MKDKAPTDKEKKAGGVSDAKATDAKANGADARDGNNPFDIWLSRKLGDMFDQVAQEPLPKELLELVQKLEEKEKKAAGLATDAPPKKAVDPKAH
jgi:hypothetical protein